MTQHRFMLRAIELARNNVESNSGGPFGCVIVHNDEIVGEGTNCVTGTNDPTAHAEIVAIRAACSALNSFQLDGCEIYVSCEPCPMCMGAIYWARPARVYYAATTADAANIGFDDAFIYEEQQLPKSARRIPFIPLMRDAALEAFRLWEANPDKITY
jgi:guanine deaminase